MADRHSVVVGRRGMTGIDHRQMDLIAGDRRMAGTGRGVDEEEQMCPRRGSAFARKSRLHPYLVVWSGRVTDLMGLSLRSVQPLTQDSPS